MTADVKMRVCEDIYRMIIYTNEKLCKPFEDSFKSQLSTMQINALCLLENYGSMTMKQLSEHLGITKQQLTRIMARLEEMGYITKAKGEFDRRNVYVSLSQSGKNCLSEKSFDYIRQLCDEIENKVDPYDFDRFSTAIVTINDIFEELSQ